MNVTDRQLITDLVAALRDCMGALEAELTSVGPDEIEENPILQEHGRVADTARGVIARARKHLGVKS